MKKMNHLLLIGLLAAYVLVFTLWSALKPPQSISLSERRPLNQAPSLSIETLFSGQFMDKMEPYLQDQFPLREPFRRLKSLITFNLLKQKDHYGIYVHDGVAAKLETPMAPNRIPYLAGTFQGLINHELKDSQGRIWFALIPDKSQYLAPAAGLPTANHEDILEQLQQELDHVNILDLKPQLSLKDFYRTDLHWRQEALLPLANYLAKEMDISFNSNYQSQTLDNPFYGVYQSQAALSLPADTVHYLTNEKLAAIKVFDFETQKTTSIYDLEAGAGVDPYSLFLSGAKALLTLENPNSTTNRELIVFRDSFGSSLIPLLAQGYSKITLVDIRYIAPSRLKHLVSFQGQDILFLYSAQVLTDGSFLQ